MEFRSLYEFIDGCMAQILGLLTILKIKEAK